MRTPGGSRDRLAGVLGSAFAEGLLSEQTLSYRLEQLFAAPLIEPWRLVGDLTLGRRLAPRPVRARLTAALAGAGGRLRGVFSGARAEMAPLVLALDWRGGRDTLLVGRGAGCDIALADETVSRRHAQLLFRDGGWIVQDLGSRNGLTVNGVAVGRAAVQPGDRLGLGMTVVEVD